MTPEWPISSLCAGIGGLEYGLTLAGIGPVVEQVEVVPECREILSHHFHGVTQYGDIRTLAALHPAARVVCAGFPCQDLSSAHTNGDRAGLQGAKSGLWWHVLRLITAARPSGVVIENVDTGAWRQWVPVVRRELWAIGYASVPVRMRASQFGAPFQGSRVFVIAAANGDGQSAGPLHAQVAKLPELARPLRQDWGRPSPRALGVAYGLPSGVVGARNAAVGNAVMPVMGHLAGLVLRPVLQHAA